MKIYIDKKWSKTEIENEILRNKLKIATDMLHTIRDLYKNVNGGVSAHECVGTAIRKADHGLQMLNEKVEVIELTVTSK